MARSFKVLAIHKQTYPATYNFRDEANGTSGTDIDFIDTMSHQDADTSIMVADAVDNHKKIIKISDTNAAGYLTADHSIGSTKTDATIEFWWAVSSVTSTNGAKFTCYESGTEICGLYINNDDIDTYQPGWASVKANFIVTLTFFHVKMVLDDTANTFDCYINGVNEGTFNYRNNSTTGIDTIIIGSGHDDVISVYYDAIGYSWDANYNVGDNCFWRHYKDQDSDFESEDVGTQGATIGFISGAGAAAQAEIVLEFNEHKKILRISGANPAYGYGGIFTNKLTGILEFWMKTTDVTARTRMEIPDAGTACIQFRINTSKFQYQDSGGWNDVGLAATNDTWYHIKIQWYNAATDTYDMWIDNVLYVDGVSMVNNMVTGLDSIWMYVYNITSYFDSFSFNGTSGNEIADNRTFDYNATYASEDVTDKITNVIYTNSIYKWREAVLTSKEDYENSEVFFQIYDVNDKLAMEAEIKSRAQSGENRTYPLRDKNWDDLNSLSSNAFSAKKIHDPTDSTSMLKVILPNVGEEEGDLLLVDGDTKTTTYSPTTKNYPDFMFLRDLADLADSCVIVAANGKVYLDDDKASGTALDFDTAADHDKMSGVIFVKDLLEEINYFEIFGAINPDAGARFYKIIDNSGSDKKRKWRYTNNAFRTQADVDAYASALDSRVTTIKVVKIVAQSLGAHNMGETINYKYVDLPYNVPQANYYVIFEQIDFDTNENVIILSEGMIEKSKYSAEFEKPQEYNDSYASEIYDTDVITVHPHIHSDGSETTGGTLLQNGDSFVIFCYFDNEMDPSRDIDITELYERVDGGGGTINTIMSVTVKNVDGTSGSSTLYSGTPPRYEGAAGDFDKIAYNVGHASITTGKMLKYQITINEAGREVRILDFSLRYYIKRSL